VREVLAGSPLGSRLHDREVRGFFSWTPTYPQVRIFYLNYLPTLCLRRTKDEAGAFMDMTLIKNIAPLNFPSMIFCESISIFTVPLDKPFQGCVFLFLTLLFVPIVLPHVISFWIFLPYWNKTPSPPPPLRTKFRCRTSPEQFPRLLRPPWVFSFFFWAIQHLLVF